VTVVLQAMSNAGRTAQLKRVVSVTNKCASRGIRRTRMQNVVCCEHTRVRCVAITWARCTRGAAVKAPEDRVHRSDGGRRLCVCSVRATVQDARSASACVCEEKECHRPGRLWPLPGDSVKCKQSNPSRCRVQQKRGSRRQESKRGSRRP